MVGGHWATWGNELSFVELLSEYADWLLLDANRPPEIKQPGRGKEALKPFLIRRLNEFMLRSYKQPFDEHVATIATVILDLTNPLTRDDVRPYLDKNREDF